jgi:hypothetical protein
MPASESTFKYAYSGEVIAAGIVFPVFGIGCVALRFVARNGKNNKVGIDDWLCVPAVVCLFRVRASLSKLTRTKVLLTAMGICLAIGELSFILLKCVLMQLQAD